ncbi:MAG: beta-lactamase family protein [Clostridia bacterium]|nr:beta-lactamase family protein [Clostridia bacterium]
MKNLPLGQARALSLLRWTLPRAPRGLALDGPGALTPGACEAIQGAFNRVFAQHRVVGGAVSLVRRGALLATFACGDARLQPRVPVAADTLFRVASVSKTIVAMGAMALVERGLLALDADIGAVLGYPVRNPAFPDVPLTLRQLLTHTSGLRDAPVYNGPGIAGALTLRQMLSPPHAARCFAPVAPGQSFYYSNFASGIVGSLMGAVTGAHFDDALQASLFEPLGITGSFLPQRMQPFSGRLATGYRVSLVSGPSRPPRVAYDAPALAAAPLPPPDPERDFVHAPGRLLISMPDLAKLLRLLGSDGAIDGARVLSPAAMDEMRALQDGRGSVTGRAGRGLGVSYCPRVMGREMVLGHQGVAYGMNSEMWFDPATGDGVAMATNGGLLFATNKLVHSGWAAARLGFEILEKL